MQHGCIPRRERSRARHATRSLPLAAPLIVALGLLIGACATPPDDTPPPASPSPAGGGLDPFPSVGDRTGAGAPAPTPPSTDRASRATDATAAGATTDERLDVAFRRARDLVERESATDLSTVRLRLVDDAEILAEVGLETRRLIRGQLGDGPLTEPLLETLLGDQGGTYAALYSGRSRSVMVSREVLEGYLASLPTTPAVRDEALLVLMLHELVHAADDSRHGIHANRALDFRASFAQSAAYEGHAQWLTRQICRREGCLAGLDALDRFMFDGQPDVASGASADPSPVDRNLLEYSYVEGERFVAAIAARPDGERLLERLLDDPPHDPLQILDPASFPNEAREQRNQALLTTALGIEHPWLTGAAPRVAVVTSPLKGVNLRGDPSRREAAIDGFTRLVTAMVAVQFHDAGPDAGSPIEVTLMRTDRPATARLFADTLHAHARVLGSNVPRRAVAGEMGTRPALRRTVFETDDGDTWRTSIATSGPFVAQASGRATTPAPMDDYVLGVIEALLAAEPA